MGIIKKGLTNNPLNAIIIIVNEREVMSMKTQKELKRELGNWYTEYYRVNKKSPAIWEVLRKAKELGLEKI